jgi:hypothetical protein
MQSKQSLHGRAANHDGDSRSLLMTTDSGIYGSGSESTL